MSDGLNDSIYGSASGRCAAALDALGLCPHCDGPRRLIRVGGDDRPIEVCDRCHVAWLGGAYAGRRLVRLGSEIATVPDRAAGR